MEVRQLRYFLSVMKLGSMVAAAREHFVTQPAISIQIKKLEEEMGEKLYKKRGGRIAATQAGALFIPQAEDILKRLESVKQSIRDLKGLHRGELKLGTIDAASIYVIPGVFRWFRKSYPGIEINVEVADSSRLVDDLSAGKIELAIVTLPLQNEDFEIIPVYEDRMVLVAHPKHPLARVRRGVLKAVAESGLITYPAYSTTRRIIEDVFQGLGLTLRATMEVSSPEAIKRLTEAGLGVSVLPLPVVKSEIRRGVLKMIPSGRVRFSRILGVIIRRREILSPPARVFVDALKVKMKVKDGARFQTSMRGVKTRIGK
jgi:DNA-binding transcriptional LysR family regulator